MKDNNTKKQVVTKTKKTTVLVPIFSDFMQTRTDTHIIYYIY